jgi:hypothetical protein
MSAATEAAVRHASQAFIADGMHKLIETLDRLPEYVSVIAAESHASQAKHALIHIELGHFKRMFAGQEVAVQDDNKLRAEFDGCIVYAYDWGLRPAPLPVYPKSITLPALVPQ